MRKVKLQMQISLDGFVAGPNGEMDWMLWNWDDELKNYVIHLTEPVDCIILGRHLAEGFIPHWSKIAEHPDDPEYAFARKMIDLQKVVFSKTLEECNWNNTALAKGELAAEINRLKKQNGKDIIIYGGATLASNLIEKHLIDELHLFVNPSALGAGKRIFNGRTNYSCLKNTAFPCGINVSVYKPASH